MFKLLRLKLKNELEQLKALHDIEIQKKNSQIQILENEMKKKLELREKELTQKNELALTEATTLLKLDYQQKLKQQEIDFQKQVNDLKVELEVSKAKFQKEIQDDNYTRLKDAMTKLHEEGNVTTKFTQDIALKMLDKMPASKTEHKHLTGEVTVNT